ncbi:MAG: carbamoyltransferase HypF [Cyclobacteriaceae bacterium]|jgi:hydrogenase maturation protein HypF
MSTLHFHIQGQVQGVGFRPYIYNLARQLNLRGWVSNGVDGVHAEVCGSEPSLAEFDRHLRQYPPANAVITSLVCKKVDESDFQNFEIIESNTSGTPNLLLTPDLGLCDSCRAELHQPDNRRFGYAFTTCLQCGPRYSIITGLPYDRPLTTMAPFAMCPSCGNEYTDPTNRRFFSQTNSCPHCAVQLVLHDAQGVALHLHTTAVVGEAARLLRQGHIVAVKGIGGFLLMADAGNARAIQQLRVRKHRPSKPFAVLFPSVEEARACVDISEVEEHELTSQQSPIVLLPLKREALTPAMQLIAPGLDRLGVMVPYAPLLALLSEQFAGPLVATSANISGSPIFFRDQQAIENLSHVADFFLCHNREIVVPQDDSVVQFTGYHKQRIVLRRSRGMAPTLLGHGLPVEENRLAMGADLKSSFAWYVNGNLYASQYLGDLENYETQESYRHTLRHITGLLKATPQEILVDEHPGYFSAQEGDLQAAKFGVPVIPVQHHLAHFSAVLAENNLQESSERILGVIWDGTGLGTDKQIWGGEFFRYEDGEFQRVNHLAYFPHLLGDKFSREPRLAALAVAAEFPDAAALLRSKFTSAEWALYNKVLNRQNGPRTSSIGRLFDGVASLLGFCDRSTYEGEAALFLETAARNARGPRLHPMHDLTREGIVKYLVRHRLNGESRNELAYQFHLALVNWIRQVGRQERAKTLAFSGGVFQNGLLVDLIITHLEDEFKLAFHRQLSPNDECIGFGQLAYRHIQTLHASHLSKTQQLCASPSLVS